MLDVLDGLGADAQRLRQHVARGAVLEEGGRDVEAGVLRVERVERGGRPVPHVDLEVLGGAREDGEVFRVQRGREQYVVAGDEAGVDGALHHKQRLGGERVRVGSDDAPPPRSQDGRGRALAC